jgi:hypothetical protein
MNGILRAALSVLVTDRAVAAIFAGVTVGASESPVAFEENKPLCS